MYYFIAHYDDMDGGPGISREISFDGQFFKEEREAYIHAMTKAYDMKLDNECLARVDFLAC